MPFVTLEPLLSHKVLRWVSGVSALVALVMLGLGIAVWLGNPTLLSSHQYTGYLFLLTTLLAALSSLSYGRQAHDRGIIAHGFGVFGLAVVQLAIGELGWRVPHIILGIVVCLGAIALFTLSLRQPRVVTSGTAPHTQEH
ncbi:MAG: hypothetical protein L0G22_10950 [Propionibacteriaceae bacterium]|nr:hypothetical protein [Propionibacteriaceae bacterium]